MFEKDPEFGEIAELYTNSAVIQVQRVPIHKQDRLWHFVNITIAPLETHENTRKPNFQAKISMQLNESAMAYFAAALMGLKQHIRVTGSRSPKSSEKKVMFVNNNSDETTNITLASDNGNNKHSQSITFSYQDRYPLIRLLASQLTKNSLGYEQTIGDTLNLIRASYMH